VGHAGNKVAEVLRGGERGHGAPVGFVGAHGDPDRTGTGVRMGFEGAVPGLAAASDSGALKFRCEGEVRLGLIFHWRMQGYDFSHVAIES